MKIYQAILLKTVIMAKSFYKNRHNLIVIMLLLLCCLLTSYNTAYSAQKKTHKTPTKQEITQAVNSIPSKLLPLAEIMSNEKPSLVEVLKIMGTKNIKLDN